VDPFRLRVANPCEEDWDAMDRTAEGRRCEKCDRVVHDLTAASLDEVVTRFASSGRPPCVRYRADARGEAVLRRAPCPASRASVLAVASLATAALAACQARYPESPSVDSEVTSTAGCKATSEDAVARPLLLCASVDTQEKEEEQDGGAQGAAAGGGICDIDPSAPGCAMQARSVRVRVPYSTNPEGIPAHSRAECADTRNVYVVGVVDGEPVHEWPEGPDVVIAGVWAEGVALDAAKQAALAMPKPLAKRYAEAIDARGGRAPQGGAVLVARVAADGAVRDVTVDSSDDLPRALVDAARDGLAAWRFGALPGPAGTVRVDVRFVFRRLP
jgi:hypothetical protein